MHINKFEYEDNDKESFVKKAKNTGLGLCSLKPMCNGAVEGWLCKFKVYCDRGRIPDQ